ncbi:DUF3991 and TOPRIM domain-containing protein [Roseomonas mucosa]|uniref:DUF3991 and TOPRIM domain-containing protein n=1 Tax=Roseomonas mucosa TaxID=207340 RepID=UPI0028CE9F41|nr:DUF3991 and TOPRIM domain-containing protein [Roseomonas mucosa]MDT8278667.1 DUF3991 and TOPRIM domain-containing protein [Roseomonas mucosa]
MSGHDEELERLREGVNCAALLERIPPPWKLDKAESTRDCLKYRRGKGEIIIVNHGGQGWWDAGGTAKGDVFRLVQHLRPDLNFGHVRKLLREMVGLQPSFPEHKPVRPQGEGGVSPAKRWDAVKPLRPGSRAWRYLTEVRHLPSPVLRAAAAAGALREGAYGTAWFAHRDESGTLTGFDMRGPEFRGFAKGGEKTLFRLPGWIRPRDVLPHRLAVAEAPIDALSLAAVERLRGDTLYVATSGGMGPGTVRALDLLLATMAALPDARLAIATDGDPPGERYAAFLADRAAAAGVPSERCLPPHGLNDWNDALRQGRRA